MDASVAYYVQGRDRALYFTPQGVTFALETETERWALKLDFVGASPTRPEGRDPAQARISYFTGPRESWRAGLPTFSKLVYPNLWPGIDLVYVGTVNRLKYEFVVQPGADPAQIRLAYRGAAALAVDAEGRLQVNTPAGSLSDDAPVAYQEVGRRRAPVSVAYDLDAAPEGDAWGYGFALGDYDPTQTLVIDPVVLVYCGYVGGGGDEIINGIAVDREGNAYLGGVVDASPHFPVQVGPDLTYNGGPSDAFVAKVNPQGTALVYCGFIGGNGEDYTEDIAVDAEGNAYLVGFTASREWTFPVTVGPDLTYGGGQYDAWIAKVNAEGTGLDYCGYIGGGDVDEAHGVAVDGVGCAYVAGNTASTERYFPVRVGPDTTFNGGFCDGFIVKVNAEGSALVYGGYIGGSANDVAAGVAVDAAGNAYITGTTPSTQATFPVRVGPDLVFNGSLDAFVAKVRSDGIALIYCGYIGGAAEENEMSITVDAAGCAYVAGWCYSPEATFPALVGPDLTHNGSRDAFVAKVSVGGDRLLYCGYVGGNDYDSIMRNNIAVDAQGRLHIAGSTHSHEDSFPVRLGPDLTFNGGYADGFVALVSADGAELIYCGYIGGSGEDGCHSGVALDAQGNAYVAGSTGSDASSFPVLVGPALILNGASDGFVAQVQLIGTPTPTPTPTSPPTATFTPSPTATPTRTATPTATPAPITQCWVSPGEERVYRVALAAFVPYDTESASDSSLHHITAPPAPVGWNLPTFQGADDWESPLPVWWPSWSSGIWAQRPEGASPIGVDDGAGQQLGEPGLTLLYHHSFTLTPPVSGWVVTRAQLETWSDNKAEWWWQGQSVAYDRQGYGGVTALFPGLVQPQGGEYTLAVQNSNDLQAGDNPQGLAYRLCVTWNYQPDEPQMFILLPIILKP